MSSSRSATHTGAASAVDGVLGKVIVVTGAGAGIGRSLAVGLADRGAQVVAATRQQADADDVAGIINAEHGRGRALGVRVDVSVEAEVEAMVAATVSAYGRLDVLVNNAAVTPNTPIMDMDFEDFMTVLRVNLGGQFLASRAAARVMIEQGGGRIIHMTSGRGVVGAPGLAAYSASKAAINNLSNMLHQELADRGVRTVAVAPGLTDTPGMRRAVGAKHIARVAGAYPGGRLGQPEDLTALIAFLSSDAAEFTSGTVISMRP